MLDHQRVLGRISLAVVGLLSLALAGPVVWSLGSRPWLAVLVLVAWAAGNLALGVLVHRLPPLVYRHTSFRVDEAGIEIRRGVYWRRVINVPRSRVQHTDVSQGPLERRHGLGTLVVYTAGTDHARVALSGLDHGVALDLRGHLLPSEASHHDAV